MVNSNIGGGLNLISFQIKQCLYSIYCIQCLPISCNLKKIAYSIPGKVKSGVKNYLDVTEQEYPGENHAILKLDNGKYTTNR